MKDTPKGVMVTLVSDSGNKYLGRMVNFPQIGHTIHYNWRDYQVTGVRWRYNDNAEEFEVDIYILEN